MIEIAAVVPAMLAVDEFTAVIDAEGKVLEAVIRVIIFIGCSSTLTS